MGLLRIGIEVGRKAFLLGWSITAFVLVQFMSPPHSRCSSSSFPYTPNVLVHVTIASPQARQFGTAFLNSAWIQNFCCPTRRTVLIPSCFNVQRSFWIKLIRHERCNWALQLQPVLKNPPVYVILRTLKEMEIWDWAIFCLVRRTLLVISVLAQMLGAFVLFPMMLRELYLLVFQSHASDQFLLHVQARYFPF